MNVNLGSAVGHELDESCDAKLAPRAASCSFHRREERKEERKKGVDMEPNLGCPLKFTLRRSRKPSGATRGPRGRPWRALECPDGADGADGEVPGRERG